MQTLAQRFYELKTKVGGNREKARWDQNTGMPPETVNRITMPNKEQRRIFGQLEFALRLSAASAAGRGNNDKYIDMALNILAKCMDVEGALTRSACAEAEKALLPMQAAAKEYELILAAHAHIDMNWMWGWQETVAATLSTFRTMLHLMREYPDFTYSQSQASVYKIVEDYDPDMMDEIKQRIKEGRWEVTATAWVETDKNMPNTESLLRHIRYTRDYMEEVWGVDPASLEVDFSPDTFGHSAHLPELDSYGNVKYYYHCRGLTERHVLYRWMAPSGREVLMYCEPYWYNLGITPDIGIGLPELSEKSGGLKTGLIVYGVGNHGGGPTRRDIERANEMKQWPVFPKIKFGTLHEYFRKAEAVREKLPIWKDEINFILNGCYTTQSRIKLGNRKSEAALLDAEGFNAMSSFVAGYKYPGDKLRRAWQDVLFTHFHDILTGSCVQETREHAIGLYADAMSVANTSRENATRALADMIDTSMIKMDADIADTLSEGAGAGYGIENFSGVPSPDMGKGMVRIFNVFNPSAHERTEAVEITVWDWTGDLKRISVADHNGEKLPFQLIDREYTRYWDHHYFRLLVEVSVPATGYVTIVMREAELGAEYPFIYQPFPRTTGEHTPVTLENDYLKAYFSPENGALLSLIDKATGKEQIKGGANVSSGSGCLDGSEGSGSASGAGETDGPDCVCGASGVNCASGSGGAGLVLWRAEGKSNNAWLIGRVLGREPVTKTFRLTPLPKGELRNGFTMEQEIMSSKIKATVTLDRNSKALAFSYEIHWHEYADRDGYQNVPVLTFSLPLAETPSAYQTDVAAGSIRRQSLYQDVSGLQYAAAVYDGEQRAVALISDCKYGYRGCEGILSSTLINSSNRPDPYPERGVHKINMWVAVDSSCPKALQVTAAAFCLPMNYLHSSSHKGELRPAASLLELSAETTVLSSVGLTGDGALLVRVYETCGKEDRVGIKLHFVARSAQMVDLDGNILGDAMASRSGVSFKIAPNTIAAVKIFK
jgi:alpha-mannosidase